jgi:Neurotransmitter-gated ion-channel ligand binding domain
MVTLFTFVTAAMTAADEAPAVARPPSVDGRPVEVGIGFYPLDFARITSREESFDLTGYLEMSWRDPGLARSSTADPPGGRPRRVDTKTTWTPRYFFENGLEQPRFHSEPVVEVDATGLVTSWVIVSGKFSAPMDLRRFPFDRQAMPVRIGSNDDDSVVRFKVKPELVLVGAEATVSDWAILRPSSLVDKRQYVPGQETYDRFVSRVELSRRSTFYVWRVMVPLTLLAVVSWAAFWFEPVGLQPQISTCMAALISLVAFNFAIDFSLPKVSYLTLIDKHALIGFGFVALSVAAVTLIHVAVTKNRMKTAYTIQRIARWAFLPAYVMALTVNFGV